MKPSSDTPLVTTVLPDQGEVIDAYNKAKDANFQGMAIDYGHSTVDIPSGNPNLFKRTLS
jgi:hypothetical protein